MNPEITRQLILVPALILLNAIGLRFANSFGTLFFLDTLATAMAAFAGSTLGDPRRPWLGMLLATLLGVAVGLGTNLLTAWKYPPYRWFLHVNVVCGALWGLLAVCFPPAHDWNIVWYIFGVGAVVGGVATVLAVPVRVRLGFTSSHLLDQISQQVWTTHAGVTAWGRMVATEFFVSHWPDKTLSTAVGVMYMLMMAPEPPNLSPYHDLGSQYHDIIELLAGYYFVALGCVINSLRKHNVVLNVDQLVLLGPLGIFSVLLALPVVLRAIGAFLGAIGG